MTQIRVDNKNKYRSVRRRCNRSDGSLSDETQRALVLVGCRTKYDVDANLRAEMIADLPSVAAHEVAEYRLRKVLGKASVGVLSSETLLCLLKAGCTTQADVIALMPPQWSRPLYITLATVEASQEVVKYLAALLRESLEPCVLSDTTLFELVEQGCCTKADVVALTKQAIVNMATTKTTKQEVVKFLEENV